MSAKSTRPNRPAASAPLDPASARWKQSLRRKLTAWFRRHQRPLPWRETRDPYAIWVSEIMLQQTQVSAVVDYYRQFLKAFPTLADLARADVEQVLRRWEGLGYYRRARNLHQAARQIVEEHAGRFPTDVDAVRALPGIGRYTAGAILSIAFDARLPILEANTVRLYSRLLGFRGDPRDGAGQRTLWEAAESWLPTGDSTVRTGELNQALMELGSLVCTPRTPDCPRCPLAALCVARRQGLVDRIPPPARKPVIEAVREAAVVIQRRGRVLVLKNPEGGRWAGLWDFPRFKLVDACTTIPELVRDRLGVEIGQESLLITLRHGVTRFRITLECYTAPWQSGPDACPVKGTLKWVEPAKLDTFPLSVTGRKLAQAVLKLPG